MICYKLIVCFLHFLARSTSEEFSSGDAGRYRETEEYAQIHAPGRDSRQDKQNKNQEERDEGNNVSIHYGFFLQNQQKHCSAVP